MQSTRSVSRRWRGCTARWSRSCSETGFKGDFPAFLKFLRTDPQFYVKTPEELLMRAAWIAKRFDGKAAQYFGYLPRARFAIKPVPDDLAPFYTAGRGGAGVYLLNTYDLPSRPLYNLTALTLHESAPGHAFQMPDRHGAQGSARVPAAHLHLRLRGGLGAVLRAARASRWACTRAPTTASACWATRSGAPRGSWSTPACTRRAGRATRRSTTCRQYTALPEHEIETEVDRYIAWPGQALSYYLGERAILDGRSRAEKALGERFNIRAFHDAVLELGSVPLPVLQTRIDRFIADGGRGPYPDME